jgi:hypothetical protein
MNNNLLFASVGALFFPLNSVLLGAPIISETFSSPSKLSNNGADFTLGNAGVYTFGTWVYSNGNSGVDETGSGLFNGTAGNPLPSTGVARAQDIRGTNARAVGVIFDGSLFTDGTTYTVSFDVIGDDGGADNGRYWLAEVGGYTSTSGIFFDGTQNGWAVAKPFTTVGTGGTATVNYLQDSVSNGVLISGETVASTSLVSFTFDYTAGTDIAFAVGTFNNMFAIDNFTITAVPEPSSFAALAGLGVLGATMLRRRRRA